MKLSLLLAAALLSACTVPPQHRSPDSALNALVEEYFERQLELSPMNATAIGDPRYDDRLDDSTSPGFREKSLGLERAFLDRVRLIDASGLTPGARITYDIFVGEREQALEGQKFHEEYMPFNQMNGLPLDLAVYGSGTGPQPFVTVKDYQRFLKRVREFPRWADGAIALMRTGMAQGITVPRVAMAKVVPQLRELVTARLSDSIFWAPIDAMPKGFSAGDRQRITQAYTAALEHEVLPAYARLADFIERDYLPAARTTVGWADLPDGQAWYRWRIRQATTMDMAPEEIHRLGLAEVARIRGEMIRVKEQVGFKGDLDAFFKYLEEDPRFYFSSEDELLDAYRGVKRRIDALLPKLFADFPKADYEIRAVEPFRAASAAGGSYQGPSADGKRRGIFYINTHNLKAQPRFGLETLSLHEASPGHHFQISIQQELTDLPRFRRFNGYVSYSEGWALYAESIGKELGVFTDPYQWYGRLSDEMLRAMRLVVDTGLHAKGWTREQAIKYMLENSSMAESDVTAEVERYIVWPGQALGYKLGQLHISELRAKAQAQLGQSFDVREFHSQILRDGAVPMAVLTAKIDRWIEAKRPPRAVK
ncbi:MAG TPA: DUF885 domain-containing protein [Steroidobacteraceae bacterium]|jgi:uncharacterized protein (DUF885 family)|nr:DUF885 domain-containing protein [Steroidobacteraceae bacterium]